MDNRRRYIFRGNAAAFGGHIIRPDDLVIEAHGASSLPVTGGRSASRVGPSPPNPFFKVDAAQTLAEGLFEDRHRFLELTNGRVAEDTLTAVTRVSADVKGLAVGQKFRLSIEHLHAELIARSSAAGHPSIQVGDVAIAGVEINGHRLVVELNPEPFRRIDTYSKLLVAADTPDFERSAADAYLMHVDRTRGVEPNPAARLFEVSRGTIYATIVRSIRWDGPEYPGSKIVGNKLIVEPDFGVVYFGELLISEYARRLTMVRMALGSETGGRASACDVEDNGGWGWSI